MFANIESIIPARLHESVVGTDEQLSIEHIGAHGEASGTSATTSPTPAELAPFRVISAVNEQPLLCNGSADSFKQTGTIQCGHIAWELTPQTAQTFLGDPRPFLMKYDELYNFYKDFMGGSEPKQQKSRLGNPSNPYPADANWVDSVIRTNTPFAREQFGFLANLDSQPLAPSFMHELGHIFGLTSPNRNAFIWKDFVEGDANLIGILPYLMAYDGSLVMGVDFWCRNKLKVEWPCDAYFTRFEDYPEWLGANKDLLEYEREKETFSTLFIRPLADQNVYERGGKFMTMLTTLYTDWKKAGKDRKFYQAYKKTQQFYTLWQRLLPAHWKEVDDSFDMPGDTILKMNTYLLLLSAYAEHPFINTFEERWRFPILQKTKETYAKIAARGFGDSVVREELERYLAPIMSIPTPPEKGLTGSYFANSDFAGVPLLTRRDSEIDFNWGSKAPAPNVPENRFSIRWEGFVRAPSTGTYTFNSLADDGVRLWVNNQLIINDWSVHAPTLNTGTIALEAGKPVPITIEYYDDWWGAVIRLGWSGPGVVDQIIPVSAFSPTN